MAGWLITAFGALTVLGAVLPWASAGPFSVDGTSGDGAITLVLGLLAAAAGVVRGVAKRPTGWQLAAPIVAMIMGLLITLIGVVDAVEIADTASVGGGLVLTVIAGLGLVGSSVFGLIKRR